MTTGRRAPGLGHASGLDAWVIQRDVQDPAAYVEMWLRDAGEQWSPRYRDLYDQWLATLERRGVLGIGFGLISLRRAERDSPVQRFQHAPQEWVQPVAPDVERWFAVQDLLAGDPARILTAAAEAGGGRRGRGAPRDGSIPSRWPSCAEPPEWRGRGRWIAFGLDSAGGPSTASARRPMPSSAAAAAHGVEPEDGADGRCARSGPAGGRGFLVL